MFYNNQNVHLQLFEKIGNKNSNKFWCKELPDCDNLSCDSATETKKHYIHRKYRQKAFCDHEYFSDSMENINGVNI